MVCLLGGGEEFLDGGEDDAACLSAAEEVSEVGTACGLDGFLPEVVLTFGEGVEELVVEVVLVGEDDDGRVFQVPGEGEFAGVEDHGEALARALGVPDDAAFLVAAHGRGADGALDGGLDGEELVVAGVDLCEGGAAVLEEDEVLEVFGEAGRVEEAVDEDVEFGYGLGGGGVTVDGAPGHEVFPAGGERSGAGLDAVGDDEDLVGGEEGGDLLFVGLELVVGGPDVGGGVGGVFEFDDGDGQAVDEDDDVGPTVTAVLRDGVLVDGEPFVVLGGGGVEDTDGGAAAAAVAVTVFNGDALGEVLVEGAVVLDEGWGGGAKDFPEGLVERLPREVGVDAGDGVLQPSGEEGLVVTVAFRVYSVGGDAGAVEDGVAHLRKPGERRRLDLVLGEGVLSHLFSSTCFFPRSRGRMFR